MDELDLGATIKGFSPGQKVFTRYTLRKLLGRGGMGVVWLARDEELERDVALKFLPEVVAMDKQSLNELKRETRRSLELTHPHIVRIYDFIQDGRAAAISMEFVAGDTLAGLKADRPGNCFDAADLRKWVRQLCEALAHAHGRAQVVHRDLKPANLMVDARGDLKVADFGIAASVSDSVSRVSAQAGTSGTPVYMSPQQMMGERPAVTDDIYSVGATLYDLLTGKPPFHSGNIIAQVQAKVPPTIADRRRELGANGGPVPAAWEQAIAACLAKEPAGRPQSATELLDMLEGGTAAPVLATPAAATVASTAPAPASVPLRPATEKKLRSGSMGRIVALSVGLALIAAGAAGWWFGVQVPARERAAAEAQAAAEQRRAAELKAEQERQAEAARQAEIARLAALRIPVTLRTNPPGAEIFLAGQSRGLAPITALPLPLGEHKIVALLKDHDDLEYTLEIVEHGQTEWTLPLVRSTGRVRVTALPSGASFELQALDEAGNPAGPVVQRGVLPAEDLSVPTGRYVVRVRSPEAGSPITHNENITVRRGETAAVTADVRGAALQVKSSPAGATVLVDGREVGRTPFLLAHQPHGAVRQIELRAEGFEPAVRSFTLARGDNPEIWDAQLKATPKLPLRPVFSQGPRLLEMRARVNSLTSGQTVASGQTTPIPPTRNDMVVSSRYEILGYDSGGWIRSAITSPETTSNGVTVFRPGTLVQFDRNGSSWLSRIAAGGFAQDSMSLEFFSPGYPAMWLDEHTLPEGLATVGRSWDVPLHSVPVLLSSLRFSSPSGYIRARVTAADPSPANGWAEVEYTFDLRGQLLLPEFSRNSLASGQAITMEGQYAGTLTLRLELAKGYVSAGRVKHKGSIETRVTQSGGGGRSLGGALLKAPAGPTGGVLAQTNMDIDTDVEFTVTPSQGAGLAGGAAGSFGPPTPAQPEVAVYFHRPNNTMVGIGATFGIEIDGRSVGRLKDGEYLQLACPAGSLDVQVVQYLGKSESHRTRMKLQIDDGRSNYFEITFSPLRAPRVRKQDPAEGGRDILRLRPAEVF